jgi:hypothetical protein
MPIDDKPSSFVERRNYKELRLIPANQGRALSKAPPAAWKPPLLENDPPERRLFRSAGAAPDVGVVEVAGTLLPEPTSIVSRKTRGVMMFGVNLPLTGTGAVECRSGGATGDHQFVLNFAAPVTVTGAGVAKGIGNVSRYNVSGSQVIVSLTGVTNAQNIFTTLSGVSDGTNSNDISIPMGVLLGDTSDNGTVNSSDVSQTKGQSGNAAGAGSFRADINLSGAVNSSDVSTVKSKSGTSLPP